jgi:predicted anti-sigma-YlaC factor YlaD
MNKATAGEECQRYLEDPEANAAHLQTCAECRAVSAALAEKTDTESASIDVNALPLASWEGSSHRPWPLVLGITAVVVAVALALCDAAGLSPLHVAESSLTSMEAMRGLIDRATTSLRAASLVWQIAFGVAFLNVNGLLIVLLRRSPRGMDA